LEGGDIELSHAEHGFECALGFGGVAVGEHLRKDFWDDLPLPAAYRRKSGDARPAKGIFPAIPGVDNVFNSVVRRRP
jgi:hypothetical protein